jgi:putative endonuclease
VQGVAGSNPAVPTNNASLSEAFIFYGTFCLHTEEREDGRYYIGSTSDVQKRLREHNRGNVRSTKAYCPYSLFYMESFTTKNEALREERFLKSPGGCLKLRNLKDSGRGFLTK